MPTGSSAAAGHCIRNTRSYQQGCLSRKSLATLDGCLLEEFNNLIDAAKLAVKMTPELPERSDGDAEEPAR